MRRLLAAACLLFGAAQALEVPPEPAPGARWGYVSDLSGTLSDGEKDALEAKLRALDRTDSTQIAVVVLPSLEGEAIEDFSVRLAQGWGIGRKGKDNGVLLLVALGDRALRIEVGYGLEGRLTDALCAEIIRGEIVPRFKAGDVPGGIAAGVEAIAGAVRGEYQGDFGQADSTAANLVSAVVLIVCILIVLVILKRSRPGVFLGRNVTWSSGSRGGGFRSGGGFGGFGGGSFGGGGASGRW